MYLLRLFEISREKTAVSMEATKFVGECVYDDISSPVTYVWLGTLHLESTASARHEALPLFTSKLVYSRELAPSFFQNVALVHGNMHTVGQAVTSNILRNHLSSRKLTSCLCKITVFHNTVL